MDRFTSVWIKEGQVWELADPGRRQRKRDGAAEAEGWDEAMRSLLKTLEGTDAEISGASADGQEIGLETGQGIGKETDDGMEVETGMGWMWEIGMAS